MKQLYIVRHGDAQTPYQAASDFARLLTSGGEQAVKRVARWLTRQPDWVAPQRIACSAAPRARRTAELLAERWGVLPEALFRYRRLYEGRSADYLHVMTRSWPDEVSCAMIVGHNPTVSELLAELLGAKQGEYQMRKGDVARLGFELPSDAPWQELYVATGRLECYVIASSL